MKVHDLFEQGRSVLSVMVKNGKPEDKIDLSLNISDMRLNSLEGSPREVGRHVYAEGNNLESLKGGPDIVKLSFNVERNKLTSTEWAPSFIGLDLFFSKNKLTSLHNIHKHIKHIGRYAYFEKNPIESHVLGLLLIDGLKFVGLDNEKVENIINKHLKGERDVFACQEELIEAGYEEYAQL